MTLSLIAVINSPIAVVPQPHWSGTFSYCNGSVASVPTSHHSRTSPTVGILSQVQQLTVQYSNNVMRWLLFNSVVFLLIQPLKVLNASFPVIGGIRLQAQTDAGWSEWWRHPIATQGQGDIIGPPGLPSKVLGRLQDQSWPGSNRSALPLWTVPAVRQLWVTA